MKNLALKAQVILKWQIHTANFARIAAIRLRLNTNFVINAAKNYRNDVLNGGSYGKA